VVGRRQDSLKGSKRISHAGFFESCRTAEEAIHWQCWYLRAICRVVSVSAAVKVFVLFPYLRFTRCASSRYSEDVLKQQMCVQQRTSMDVWPVAERLDFDWAVPSAETAH